MLTKEFSPYLLRFSIEIEMQQTNDAKVAAMTAISRLKNDPMYYHNKYGFVDTSMEKARITKYIKRIPDGKGGWKYIYKEDNRKKNIK